MRVDFRYTQAKNGGFGVLGKGIEAALLQLGHEVTRNKPDVVMCYGVGQLLQEVGREYGKERPPLVFYTVWESSDYPKDWAEIIKAQNTDLVLTATQFTVNSLKAVGVDAKVWHHGIDTRWRYKPRRDDGLFTFLHYNAYEWRKGWEIVLKAFTEEFAVTEPVRLILKARERGESVWIVPQPDAGLEHPLITELIGHISDEAMVNMMDTADAGVFPVKGEGWFLPATECAACGIPPILPKHMQLTEQWIDGGYIPLELDGWIHAMPRYPGYMMMPSVDDLRKKMRWCVDNEPTVREMGRRCAREVQRRFNWRKIGKDLEKYLISITT